MTLTWELPEKILLDNEVESHRVDALHSLKILGTEPEERFDRITRLAAEVFGVSVAYVALLDSEQQWFKSSFGPNPMATDRKLSLCQYTLHLGTPLVIPDARVHPLSQNHPMVTGEPHIRFYAGVPLTGPRGHKIGTLCLTDFQPRNFPEEQLEQLKAFAAIVEREINLSDVIKSQHELLNARQELAQVQDRLKREFEDAAKYVRLMLPPHLSGRESIHWHFHPSAHLGGDGLGYRRINADQIAFYVLDVTGHGLGSALLAVTALELLRSRTVREIDYSKPALVIERLNRTFQMKDHAGKFFSVWYGVYSHSTRKITYANAGHPPALLATLDENGALKLEKTPPGGPTLGVLQDIPLPEITIDFPRGSELFIFTDGLYEIRDSSAKSHGSYNEFLAHLEGEVAAGNPLYESILRWLERAHEAKMIDDDVSLLRFKTKKPSGKS